MISDFYENHIYFEKIGKEELVGKNVHYFAG